MAGITWESCVKCGVKWPTPSLTKQKICLVCQPPKPLNPKV